MVDQESVVVAIEKGKFFDYEVFVGGLSHVMGRGHPAASYVCTVGVDRFSEILKYWPADRRKGLDLRSGTCVVRGPTTVVVKLDHAVPSTQMRWLSEGLHPPSVGPSTTSLKL